MSEQTIGVRTERRQIRPFSGLSRFDELFRLPVLSYAGGVASPPSTIYVEPDCLQLGSIEVALNMAQKDLLEAASIAKLPPEAVDLVLLARGRTLRRSTVVYRKSLSSSISEEIRVESEPLDENSAMVLGDGSGKDILLLAVLNQDLSPEGMRASVAGTWLGLCKWRILPVPSLGRSFIRLTDEMRAYFALPAEATSYVHIQGEDFSDFGALSSAVQHYVDADLLDAIRVEGPVVRTLTTALAVELLTQLTFGLAVFVSEKDDTPGEVFGSALDDFPGIREFMERLAHPAGIDAVEFANDALKKPYRVAPVVQAAMGSREVLYNAMVGGA